MEEIDLKTLLISRGLKMSAVAEAIGVDKSQMTRWSQRRVPAERVRKICDVTGLAPHEIRPDIFPKGEGAAA